MTPVETLARTIWGEARSEGESGMTAVANVVINRCVHARWWGHDITSVCREPYQFSAWNPGDPNLPKLLAVTTADKQYLQCLAIAAQAASWRLSDITKGATTYKAVDTPWPHSWGAEVLPLVTIGHHEFFNLDAPHQPTKGHPQ